MEKRTDTCKLIDALYVLAKEMKSDDVSKDIIVESADRLAEYLLRIGLTNKALEGIIGAI